MEGQLRRDWHPEERFLERLVGVGLVWTGGRWSHLFPCVQPESARREPLDVGPPERRGRVVGRQEREERSEHQGRLVGERVPSARSLPEVGAQPSGQVELLDALAVEQGKSVGAALVPRLPAQERQRSCDGRDPRVPEAASPGPWRTWGLEVAEERKAAESVRSISWADPQEEGSSW